MKVTVGDMVNCTIVNNATIKYIGKKFVILESDVGEEYVLSKDDSFWIATPVEFDTEPEKPVNEWIPFRETECSICPVPKGTNVEVRFNDNDTRKGEATGFTWYNTCGVKIVAYRVI